MLFSQAQLDFDRDHIWHPYSSLADPLPCYPVVSAQGIELTLADGRTLIDGMSAWWAAIHGYNVPALNQAITEQLQHMSHVMFGGLTHLPAITLCQQLLALTPAPLTNVFLADSGSVAVEVAMKMAVQYRLAQGDQRHRFLTIRHGYYGDTANAMSLADPDQGIHSVWSDFLPPQYFADAPRSRFDGPYCDTDIDDLKRQLRQHSDSITAIMLEPIAQNAGGLWFYHPEFLRQVRALCDQYGILLIFDEIATGFGRTGKLFALEHADVCPDILCLGKALTGGYMTLSAVMTTDTVAKTVCQGAFGAFMHGPTFMGNPLACAVANRSIELLLASPWQQQVEDIAKALTTYLTPCQAHANVVDVRVLGAIGVVETDQPVNVAKAQRYFVEAGVWIRPFNRFIYLMPPYIASAAAIKKLGNVIEQALYDGAVF